MLDAFFELINILGARLGSSDRPDVARGPPVDDRYRVASKTSLASDVAKNSKSAEHLSHQCHIKTI